MKKLELNQLHEINGSGFWDGVCIGVGAINIFASFLKLTPVGAVILGAADIACLSYTVATAD